MKLLLLPTTLITILFLSGCRESHSDSRELTMLNGHNIVKAKGVNPNSLAYQSEEKAKDRETTLTISKIESNAKIEIAKIESQNRLEMAKVNANSKEEIAVTNSHTKIKTSEIDAINKKEDIQSKLYITIAIIILVMLALILLYLNNKKNRELKAKLHQEQLEHEKELREREFEERRIHKMLELVADGKLNEQMEQEVIHSLTKPKTTTIEAVEDVIEIEEKEIQETSKP